VEAGGTAPPHHAQLAPGVGVRALPPDNPETARHRSEVADVAIDVRNSAAMAAWFVVIE
jgi:hypothetical protein